MSYGSGRRPADIKIIESKMLPTGVAAHETALVLLGKLQLNWPIAMAPEYACTNVTPLGTLEKKSNQLYPTVLAGLLVLLELNFLQFSPPPPPAGLAAP